MKGSRILGAIAAAFAVASFTGFLTGASHQIFIAILFTIISIVAYSVKIHKT